VLFIIRFSVFIIGFMGLGMYGESALLDEFAIFAFSGVAVQSVFLPAVGAGTKLLLCLEN
jgi:hypothetical protein